MTRLGIITGLASEAKLARHAIKKLGLAENALVVCAGPGIERADAATRGFAKYGFDVVASFGLAGALAPGLHVGTLILPRLVVGPDDAPALAADASLREKLLAILGGGAQEVKLLLSTTTIVTSPAMKARLAADSGADAVDMESYGVARAAVSAGIPFIVLRAIVDSAARAIPHAAQAGVTPEGRVRAAPVLMRALTKPQEIPEIVRLARDNNRALASLSRAARLAFPLLLFGR